MTCTQLDINYDTFRKYRTKMGKIRKKEMMVQKLESLSQNAAPKHPKKDPAWISVSFSPDVRRSWGHVILTDFGTFKPLMLPQVGLNSGWGPSGWRIGDFCVDGFDQLVWWGFLTGVIFSVFKMEDSPLKLWISNLHAPISVQAGNTNPRNPWTNKESETLLLKNWLPNGIFWGCPFGNFFRYFLAREK